MNRQTVTIDLAGDAQFARDLAVGGVFVPGCALQLTQECDLVVRGAQHEVVVPARVVYVDEHGAGLELIGFSTEMKTQLAELEPVAPPELEVIEVPVLEELAVDEARPGSAALDLPADRLVTSGVIEVVPLIDLVALEDAGEEGHLPVHPGEENVSRGTAPGDDPALAGMLDLEGDDDGGADAGPSDVDSAEAEGAEIEGGGTAPRRHGGTPRRVARNVHERLRGLTLAAQIKVATSGELHERIVIERLYGKNVWETLLRNPRLTPPEVSRIARYGSLPRVLLEIIVGNNTWLQVPEVRRALLSNPRLGTDQVMKVLRLTPRHELKLAAIQTSYPHAVRSAAKMLMLRDE